MNIDISKLFQCLSFLPSSVPQQPANPSAEPNDGCRFIFKTVNQQGRKALFFDFMSLSDVHLGTNISRAKRLSHALHNTVSNSIQLVGDIIDGEYMLKKPTWNFGPFHRQVLGHMFRKIEQGKEVTFLAGNHEVGLRDKILNKDGTSKGYSLYGISLENKSDRTDVQGRKIHSLHGDIFDDSAYEHPKVKPFVEQLTRFLGSEEAAKDFIYHVFNTGYEALSSLDMVGRQIPGCEHKSFAAFVKRNFKTMLDALDVKQAIIDYLDDSEHEVLIYGHTHMAGFSWTPQGKLIINDGSSIDHVNILVQDEEGTFAILTWHRDRIDVEEEPLEVGQPSIKYSKTWEELGVENFHKPVPVLENEATHKADRVTRLIYRLWPPQDHSINKAIQKQIKTIQHLAFSDPEKVPEGLLRAFHAGTLSNPPIIPPIERHDISGMTRQNMQNPLHHKLLDGNALTLARS